MCCVFVYRNLLKTWNEFKWLLELQIFLENMPTSHAVNLALVVYAYSDSAYFCHAFAYTITANGVCLHLLVPPLAQCRFLLNITACTAM